MAVLLASLLVAMLNVGLLPQPTFEDESLVALMGDIAIDAVIASDPACAVEGDPVWDFTLDDSGGLSVIGRTGTCESAGWFYRSPETHRWVFEVAGS